MQDSLIKPPTPCPLAYVEKLKPIHEGLSKLYTQAGIPYFIQASLATAGFVTTADIKFRWTTPQAAIENSPKELHFEANKNGYDAATSLHTAIRLGQVLTLASKAFDREVEDQVKPEMDDYKSTLMTGQRQEFEKAYLGCYKEVAKISNQGSDHFTAVVNRTISRGLLPYTDLKHIVPYMPELDSRPSKRKKTYDGEEFIEESIWEPREEKTWKQTMNVFRTTLLMCLAGNPNQTKLKLSKESLDDFYEWIYGEQMLTRQPAPSLKVVMYTERKAWKQISIWVHEGMTLQDSLKKIREDTFFWIMEVYERVGRGKGSGEYADKGREGKGKWDKGKGDKGKGKAWDSALAKGKAKGKAKWNASPSWQSSPQASASSSAAPAAPLKQKTWAKTDPKGKEYCKKHLVYQNCPGQCKRSHNCPIMKQDNTPCNGNHLPGPNCPHY
jgi:hypothetical protein